MLLTHTDGKPFTVNVAPISKVECEKDIGVSTIEKDGKTYYVFVSTNPFESIVVKFTRNNDYSNAWSPVTSNLTPLSNLKEGPEFEIMFEPGGYGII